MLCLACSGTCISPGPESGSSLLQKASSNCTASSPVCSLSPVSEGGTDQEPSPNSQSHLCRSSPLPWIASSRTDNSRSAVWLRATGRSLPVRAARSLSWCRGRSLWPRRSAAARRGSSLSQDLSGCFSLSYRVILWESPILASTADHLVWSLPAVQQASLFPSRSLYLFCV